MIIKFNYSYYILAISFIICGYFSNLLVFTSIIIIHELGHVIVAKLTGCKVNKITIYSYGGVTEINSLINNAIYKDLLISIGGICIQLLYYILILLLYRMDYIREYIFDIFLLYNNSILFFNILPVYPLDGAKVISSILYYFFPYKFVNKITCVLSLVVIIILLYFNYYKFNFSFILIINVILYDLIKYYRDIKYYFNKFLLERYLYNIRYKKNKIIDRESLMYRDKYHIFNIKSDYFTEKQYLNKKFKNNK